MTDRLLALKVAEALAANTPETTILLRCVPIEFVREYASCNDSQEYADRERFFDNGSKILVSVLPF